VFRREEGTPLDRWHVRKEFQNIAKAAWLGGARTPRELRHSFVSILSAHDVRPEDISDLVGHSSTSVTETIIHAPPTFRSRATAWTCRVSPPTTAVCPAGGCPVTA
jgi:integrase